MVDISTAKPGALSKSEIFRAVNTIIDTDVPCVFQRIAHSRSKERTRTLALEAWTLIGKAQRVAGYPPLDCRDIQEVMWTKLRVQEHLIKCIREVLD